MKVAFIAIKGIDIIGGIETYTIELGKRLVQAGHEVVIYCIKSEKYNKPFMYKGMQIIPLPTIRHKYFSKITVVILASLHQFSIRQLDIVHYHAVGPSLFAFIPRLSGRYVIFQSHGHEWERSSWNRIARWFFRFSEKVTFWFVHDSTAVSKALSRYYLNKYGQEVTYIPSGISPRNSLEANTIIKRYKIDPGKYFLYVGRVSREKGIHDLIQAYQKLQRSDIKLVIVGKERPGDQAYLAELKELAAGNVNILFVGPAYGNDLIEWYSNNFAYVLPSRIEGLPITLLEAMSFGSCCIASDIEANVEALGGKGLLFEEGNIDSLLQCLRNVCANPEMAGRIGDNLRIHVLKRYTWSFIRDEFIEFYRKAEQLHEEESIALPDTKKTGVTR